MTRIFWHTFFIISGCIFTFGAGPSNSAIIEANISFETNSTAASVTSSSISEMTGDGNTSTPITYTVKSSFDTFPAEQTNSTDSTATVSTNASTADAANNTLTNKSVATTNKHPAKKFVAAAVRSHFDDCPDSHQHFCFHGTCRFLILEETPACVCHPGFVGIRCEYADLLAVVATNHRQQTVATVLVLCVIGCVLIMVLCSLLHCWWRQDCRRRNPGHHYITEKRGGSCYPTESVV